MYFLYNEAAIVDLDNSRIDLPKQKMKIPSRQRKKLIHSLEKHCGKISEMGIPDTIKYAFPGRKLGVFSLKYHDENKKVAKVHPKIASLFKINFLHASNSSEERKTSDEESSSIDIESKTSSSESLKSKASVGISWWKVFLFDTEIKYEFFS